MRFENTSSRNKGFMIRTIFKS